MTKITHSATYPKPLQRQNVSLVCQVSNDKTVAALKTLKNKIKMNEGTIKFVQMITNWFKMMNIKDKYSCVYMRVEFSFPWTLGCDGFKRLNKVCDVISTCASRGGRGRAMQLTKMTASTLVITKKVNIDPAYILLTEMKFSYVLQLVFADEVLQNFFDQTRQRIGLNFYIGIRDATAAAKTVNIHNLFKWPTSRWK